MGGLFNETVGDQKIVYRIDHKTQENHREKNCNVSKIAQNELSEQ